MEDVERFEVEMAAKRAGEHDKVMHFKALQDEQVADKELRVRLVRSASLCAFLPPLPWSSSVLLCRGGRCHWLQCRQPHRIILEWWYKEVGMQAKEKCAKEEAEMAARIAYEVKCEFEKEEAARRAAKEALVEYLAGNEENKKLREIEKQRVQAEDIEYMKKYEAILDKQQKERLARLEKLQEWQVRPARGASRARARTRFDGRVPGSPGAPLCPCIWTVFCPTTTQTSPVQL